MELGQRIRWGKGSESSSQVALAKRVAGAAEQDSRAIVAFRWLSR